MTRTRRVDFDNARGERLVGILHGEIGERAAICCHGMLSTKDSEKHTRLAEILAARGMAALRFDFAGCGESAGVFGETTYSSRVADLEAAIAYLVELGAGRLVLFGSSMGGAVALLAAARDERVVAVATLAAVGHPADIESRHPEVAAAIREHGYVDLSQGRLGPAFIEDARQHDVISAVGVILAPILVIHGVEDEVVPVSDAHDIASAARHVSLNMVDGADHRFSDPNHLGLVLPEIADFLIETAWPVHRSPW